jgi:ribulose-phosphate 3-epimerase
MPSQPGCVLIAPSILAADFGRLHEEVQAVAAAGADYIHVDVMDGRFVPNITIGQPVVAALRRATELPLDVHLMIEEPERYVESFAAAGAELICVHVEACRHLHRTVQHIRSLGKRPAVSLNPATPPEAVGWVLDDVEMVLVMSVNPGFGGQAFIPAALAKVRALRAELDRRGLQRVDIEIDGGIVVDNIEAVVAAGANVIVSGTGIFHTARYSDTIAAMRAAAAQARWTQEAGR